MKDKISFSLKVGMSEFMFCGGIYLFTVAKYLSLSLICLGICCALVRYCMERNDEEEREKTTKKLIKEVCDSATVLSLANMVPTSKKLN